MFGLLRNTLAIVLVVSFALSACASTDDDVGLGTLALLCGGICAAGAIATAKERQRVAQEKSQKAAIQMDRQVLADRARQGDEEAQYRLGVLLHYEGKSSESWKWLCKAAGQSVPEAQAFIGDQYRIGTEYSSVPRNYPRAYMWYALAASHGHAEAEKLKTSLSEEMTTAQVAEGKQLLAQWQPDPSECEATATSVSAP